jgi:hypothetical protein
MAEPLIVVIGTLLVQLVEAIFWEFDIPREIADASLQ